MSHGVVDWIGVNAPPASIAKAATAFPDLKVQQSPSATLISGLGLTLGDPPVAPNASIDRVLKHINRVLLLDDPFAEPLRFAGSAVRVDGAEQATYFFPPPGKLEFSGGHPVILSSAGRTEKRTPRTMRERVADLCTKEPDFGAALDILAVAGTDLRELYRVVEAVERGNGGFPKKRPREPRLTFCRRIGVSEDDWEALHRSCRPARHYKPHQDGGPSISATQARRLIHHALKLWLERKVPF